MTNPISYYELSKINFYKKKTETLFEPQVHNDNVLLLEISINN